MRVPLLPVVLSAALLSLGLATPARADSQQLTAVFTLAQPAGTAAAVHQLAGQRARRGALHALTPPVAHRDAAVAFARAHDLKVVRADAWSVTVTGTRQQLAAAVPQLPRQDVASVVGVSSQRLHRSHAIKHATQDGELNPQTSSSLRAHYDVPTTWRGAGMTVGIINLAGWSEDDLSTYASHEGIPLAPGQITEVPVGLDPTQLDGFGSEYEVALDAEAVLGAAPEAKQRLYFAPNTTGGVVSGFEQVAADAEAGLLQVVTTSWGSCERDFDQVATPADRAAYTAAIDRILAAGATVFAASGDAGAYDCGSAGAPDDEAQVDFPASYPNTVAVGGTTLTAGLPETGWSDPGFGAYLGDGSGGGQSVEQPIPSYQVGLAPDATRRLVPDLASDADPASGMSVYVRDAGGWSNAGGTSLSAPLFAGMFASALSSRPDQPGLGNILPAVYQSANDAETPGFVDVIGGNNGLFTAVQGYDEVTGLGVPDWNELGSDLLATSAGAPVIGATDPVARPGRSPDPTLVVGYTSTLTAPVIVVTTPGSTFTGYDIGETVPACSDLTAAKPTSVTLPADAEQGTHLITLTAFDSAHVCHLVTASLVYDTGHPTTTLGAALLNTQSTQLRLSLGGSDVGSGIASWSVVVRDGQNHVVQTLSTTTPNPVVSGLAAGQRYVLTATSQDRAGNLGSAATLVATFAADDTVLTRGGTWTRVRGTVDYLGTHLQSQQAGASVSLTATAKRIDVYLLRGPGQGFVDVYVDGRKTTRYDLYAASTSSFRPTLGTWSAAGKHTVKLLVVGTHPAGSKGSYLSVDGILSLT